MQNLKLWVALLIVAAILAIIPFVPEGAARFTVLAVALAAACFMYWGSHRVPKL